MRMNFKPNQAFIKQGCFFSTCLWTAHEFTGWIHTLDQVYYSQTQEEECVVKSELPHHITSPFFPAREGGAAPHDTRAQLTTVGNYEISFNPRAAGLTVMSRQHSATTPRQHWWRGFLKKSGEKKKGKIWFNFDQSSSAWWEKRGGKARMILWPSLGKIQYNGFIKRRAGC